MKQQKQETAAPNNSYDKIQVIEVDEFHNIWCWEDGCPLTTSEVLEVLEYQKTLDEEMDLPF